MLHQYDSKLVFLSYAISFLGSYLTISLCEQLRLQTIRENSTLAPKTGWFILMGISLGGVGIWCMHFIGMAAMRLYNDEDERVHLYFNIPITVTSLLIAIFMTAIGSYVLSQDRLFAKSKSELFEMFVDDLQHLSIADIRKAKDWTMLKIITSKDMGYLLLGGVITGAGVSIMHYIGMEAVIFDGRTSWNGGIIFASVCISIVASFAAYWILFRLLSIFPKMEGLRVASSLIMATAVCGMHYTGMEAAMFHFSPSSTSTSSTSLEDKPYLVSDEEVTVPLLVCSMFVSWLIVMIALADLRNSVHTYQLIAKRKGSLSSKQVPLSVSKNRCLSLTSLEEGKGGGGGSRETGTGKGRPKGFRSFFGTGGSSSSRPEDWSIGTAALTLTARFSGIPPIRPAKIAMSTDSTDSQEEDRHSTARVMDEFSLSIIQPPTIQLTLPPRIPKPRTELDIECLE